MLYFDFYGTMAFHITMLLCTGIILAAFIIHYSVRAYRKPTDAAGEPEEHAEPGVPLVLKGLYFGVALYIIIITIWIASKGIAI